MLIDLDGDTFPEMGRADVIVVGSGAVGLPLAIDLARAGLTVLVLEAGGLSITKESQAFFTAARRDGHPLNGLHTGRVRALGGTTNFWGGQLVPFDSLVFSPRPWVADVEWPLTRAEIEPFYDRAFDVLGMTAQIANDFEIWHRLGVVPPPDTEDLSVFFTRWTPESNFATLFDLEIKNRLNLIVAVNAPVTALEAAADDVTVTGVSVRTKACADIQISGRHVILANGTIEIARLLKLNLSDGRPAPWASNAWIGRGFMDHLDCYAGQVKPIEKKRFHDIFDNAYIDGIKYNPKIKLSEKAQIERQLVGISAYFIFNSSVTEHIENAKIFFKALLKGRIDRNPLSHPGRLVNLIRVAGPMVLRYVRYRRMNNFADRGIQLRLASEQRPLASSGVTLKSECDALGMPLIEVKWKIDGSELRTFAVFADLVCKYLAEADIADVEIDPRLAALDPSFMTDIEDTNHHMGTARMSFTSESGVVNRDLKVHGTKNLYIAGAAVYPTSGFPNPTFNAIAIGLRLASAIKEART